MTSRAIHSLRTLAMLSASSCASNVPARDAAVVNADTVTIRFENERVRVLEAVLPPGAKEAQHAHPAHVLHVVSGGTMRSHAPAGSHRDATLQTGQILYRDPLTHWAENIGDSTVRVILIELKH